MSSDVTTQVNQYRARIAELTAKQQSAADETERRQNALKELGWDGETPPADFVRALADEEAKLKTSLDASLTELAQGIARYDGL